ncbi:MAG: purine-binding chemotaxis protein CheW [Myxococcales bacterium]|nr:purine-binding chemotaxis protein CheW [Myxococcales bacterium]MBL9111522.1 purine-binding chemotaxis protein CheW [Myxococcales bacterium]
MTFGPRKRGPRPRLDPRKSLVGFVVGDVTYAVGVEHVREVTNPLSVVVLPGAPRAVIGVADFRGKIVPVVDLRLRFGLEHQASTRKTKWLVVEIDGRLVGLVVDHVTDVFGTVEGGPRPTGELVSTEAALGVVGVVDAPTGMAFVIDIAPLGELARAAKGGDEPRSPRKTELP